MKKLLWVAIVFLAMSCTEKEEAEPNIGAAFNESATVKIYIRNKDGEESEGRILTVGSTTVSDISDAGSNVTIESGERYMAKILGHEEIIFSVLYSSIEYLNGIGFQLNKNNPQEDGCGGNTTSHRIFKGFVYGLDAQNQQVALDSVRVRVGGTEVVTDSSGNYEACFPCALIPCNEQEITYRTKNNISVTIRIEKDKTSDTTIDVFIDDDNKDTDE